MKALLGMLLLSVGMNVLADTNRVFDIIEPETKKENYLALLDDGRVVEILPKNTHAIEELYTAKAQGLEAKLKYTALGTIKGMLGKREIISSVELLSNSDSNTVLNEIPTPTQNYSFTTISDMKRAENLFETMRTDARRRSQCYNRAHVWAYELDRYHSLKTRKIFIFFTRKYIRQYNYDWWFHVAPLTSVAGQTEDVVFDREFSNKPQLQTDWKNDYMKNKANCPEVQFFTHYYENQEKEHCYLIKTSMYYWQPFEIENLETGGPEKKNWVSSEVEAAYRRGF